MLTSPLAPSGSRPQAPVWKTELWKTDESVGTPGDENGTRFKESEVSIDPRISITSGDGSKETPAKRGHQSFVFCDPVAFRYLEEDPATTVLGRRRRLEGYEIFVVEQWACSRVHPTFIIATYTGDASHSILVGVLNVPVDENAWSSRLKTYFKAVSQFHARRKETPLGTMMITNLSGFPSALTVIAVPDGDIKKHREDFIVNENLKRLGCSGRAGLNLQPPQQSTRAKYHYLYRTSEVVSLGVSVMELVKLCQVALTFYDKLLPAYADGLLCDVTEKAINDWWSDIGTYIYNIEPTDGILGPTTVAALLGLLLGAYNRLKATGAPVGKDIFDGVSTKRAIGYFQKQQKINRTRRLDRLTLDKLHRATAKTASGEGWNVPKAVKSTVAELSGKGGEMVMGIVGAREKVGIAEVETLDIERLSQLVTGPRMKWLWQGKPIKTGTIETLGGPSDDLNGRVFSSDDQGNFMWTSRKRDSVLEENIIRQTKAANDQASHTTEGRSGLGGRLRDAVGIRSHHSKQSKDDTVPETAVETEAKDYRVARDHLLRPPIPDLESFNPRNKPPFDVSLADLQRNASTTSLQSTAASRRSVETDRHSFRDLAAEYYDMGVKHQESKVDKVRKAMADDRYQDLFEYRGLDTHSLRRSQSAIKIFQLPPGNPRSYRVPRHLSFSAVEDAVLPFEDLSNSAGDETYNGMKPAVALSVQEADTALAQSKGKKILRLEQARIPWIASEVDAVEDLTREAHLHHQELNDLYYQKLEEHQALRMNSTDLLGEEKVALAEGWRRIEVSRAKLDYEVSSLQSRVEELEFGVSEFERSVTEIEARVRELVDEESGRVSWFYWIMKFTGSNYA